MKVRLMHRDRDFDLQAAPAPNEEALCLDLELHSLFDAMAAGDDFLRRVASRAVLSSSRVDRETIMYRQAILEDCLENYELVKSIHDLALACVGSGRRSWLGVFSRSPGSVLYEARELLTMLFDGLVRLKEVTSGEITGFRSEGFRRFFEMLHSELEDEYLAQLKASLKELRFRHGVMISARLGDGNRGTDYVLRQVQDRRPGWLRSLFLHREQGLSFRLDPRDESGARALSELRDRGINLAANAAAQSADHVLRFFLQLRTELAFYLACVNLHRRLVDKNIPVCFPVPDPAGSLRCCFSGLRDVALALTLEQGVVGNDLDAEGIRLLIVTGANQGGKTTFLRSVGLAQLMMQAGMFVAAESFEAGVSSGVFTHWKREEDTTMEHGKFDEELTRMSGIVDALTPNALLLFNESFAATNEREGSEIARQIVRALVEGDVRVFYVTHLYPFAQAVCEEKAGNALCLRAERDSGGRRTFKIRPGRPLRTSFGADLYRAIFREETTKSDGQDAPDGIPASFLEARKR